MLTFVTTDHNLVICRYIGNLPSVHGEVCEQKKRKEKNNVSLRHVNNQALMHGPLSFLLWSTTSKLFDYFSTTQAEKKHQLA